ncbi:thromboxane-A synthase isoform X1 [Astyanax mexicanus]|uniref:thromboxane-A synthase isoform X1 n=1 Tax=Astyanax mexicanus TaxID=7994 RepID=UPI0020CB679E|nr:thromboxane-A synthase isoform X1 [Astyanax mexicanus]
MQPVKLHYPEARTCQQTAQWANRKRGFWWTVFKDCSLVVVSGMLEMIGAQASGFTVTLGLFLLFLALLYWYSVYPFSVLQRCGIRHPKPIPFFGNMMLFRHGFFDAHRDLINQYGRVCGYYLGRRPVVVVADPDMLRQVMVKEFQKFPNRMKLRAATKPMTESVLMLRNERWKRVRSILTPSFSAAKMKEMVPLINTATETLLNNLKSYAESGESFDIHRCFGCFTMDVIASVAFGTQVDSQNDPNDPFVHHASKFFSFSFFRPIMFVFMAFPFLIRPLSSIIPNKSRDEMNGFFISCIQKIIKQRDELPPNQRRRDFLQLMLDVRSSKECVSLENFDVVNHADEQAEEQPQVAEEAANGPGSSGDAPKRPQQKRMMTEDEIVGQAFLFLLAGYETSSNTLAFACYLLAINPDCQEKLQREVDDFFTRHGSADYTNVQELKYLDMVVCEALRLYPPGFRFARDVEEDCVINGQFLPKGATLDISAGFLHHDPQYWPEPEKFIPERFTPEAKASRHPFVYLPFGAGPRSCVGMRLAQLEIRMALVNIFKKFNVVACEDTKVPLQLKSSTTLGPKNGIFVKITKRLNSDDI